MNVDEFLTELYNDELSDMFIGNRNSKEEPREKLLPLMNKAMLQAYAKYNIKFAVAPLTVVSNENTYVMVEDDVMAVMAVVGQDDRVLKAHEVQVIGQIIYFPDPAVGEYTVRYKVKPVRFTEDQVDKDVVIELPDMLLPWMSSWVAAKTFLSRKDDVSIAKGTELMALANDYENQFIATNTTNEYTRQDSHKLQLRGFG